MSIEEVFQDELTRRTSDEVVTTDRIARACAVALPVDGAGLSYTLTPDRRIPLGASDARAALAERLQFAVGEGPCRLAQRTKTLVDADIADLRRRWPVYATQLVAQTPFRRVIALPVGGAMSGAAAIDLYSLDEPHQLVDADDLQRVSHLAGQALVDTLLSEGSTTGLPPMINTPSVARRERVWVALGFLGAERTITASAAMALLRAHAFVHDIDLETAADRVLAGDPLSG